MTVQSSSSRFNLRRPLAKSDSKPQPTRLGTDSYYSLVGKSTRKAICKLPQLYISMYIRPCRVIHFLKTNFEPRQGLPWPSCRKLGRQSYFALSKRTPSDIYVRPFHIFANQLSLTPLFRRPSLTSLLYMPAFTQSSPLCQPGRRYSSPI
jgi:hypothetical protein